jgi:septal ring factor EnvC (AmiA/AmiB activator)
MEKVGIKLTNSVAFKAGYGDPYRTIAKKMGDYGAIEEKSRQYALRNEVIHTAITELKTQVTSLAATIKNVANTDEKAIKTKIEDLNKQIQKKEEEFQYNRDMITNLYYSYHERL